MAFELAAEALGGAVIEALRRRRPALAQRADQALEWLRDVAQPPAGIELRAEDGSLYTGFVIIDRNRPVVMLAVRHQPAPASPRPPVITPAPVQRPLYGDHRIDPDSPYWDCDSTPYGR